MENNLEYEMDIQEVAGKHVVENFLDEFVAKCNELGVYCEISIGDKMKGGAGESTFPFNMFEKAASGKGAGIFERLFSFSSPKKEDEVSDESAPIPEIKKEIDLSYKTGLKDVTGIVHVNIKVEGGSRELCQIFRK